MPVCWQMRYPLPLPLLLRVILNAVKDPRTAHLRRTSPTSQPGSISRLLPLLFATRLSRPLIYNRRFIEQRSET